MENRRLIIRRIIYLAMFILSLVFISFRGGSLPYMLFFMMVVNTLFLILYILYVFFTVRIFQSVPERRVTKNETVSYRVQLQNESFIAYRSVGLRFMEQLSRIKASEELGNMEFEAGQGIDINTELVCKYSGTYFVGVDTIEIMDYFKIFKIRFHMPQKLKLTVMPRIIKPDNIAFITEEECKNSSKRGKGEYLTDNEVRRYVSGDSKRLIHWKNSAKRQELMVKTLVTEELSEYVVVLDPRVKAADFESRVILCDKMRETAIALVYYIYCSGYQVLSVFDDSYEKEIKSQRDFDSFYNKITDYVFGRKTDFYTTLRSLNNRIREGVSFIIISSEPEDSIKELLGGIGNYRSIHVIDVNRFDNIEEFR